MKTAINDRVVRKIDSHQIVGTVLETFSVGGVRIRWDNGSISNEDPDNLRPTRLVVAFGKGVWC